MYMNTMFIQTKQPNEANHDKTTITAAGSDYRSSLNRCRHLSVLVAIHASTGIHSTGTEWGCTMTYKIIDGSNYIRWSEICTPKKTVWVFDACTQQKWQIKMRLASTDEHDVPYYIHGTIYKHIIPELTYSLTICSECRSVKHIDRMYFASMEAAAEYAQTFIAQVVNGGAV